MRSLDNLPKCSGNAKASTGEHVVHPLSFNIFSTTSTRFCGTMFIVFFFIGKRMLNELSISSYHRPHSANSRCTVGPRHLIDNWQHSTNPWCCIKRPIDNRAFQSVVFNSGQKMALRAFYFINIYGSCKYISTYCALIAIFWPLLNTGFRAPIEPSEQFDSQNTV